VPCLHKNNRELLFAQNSFDGIEAIGNVDFNQLHWSMLGVLGVHDGMEDPLESFAELHRLSGGPF
jgi:hypothetical protein